MNAEPTLSCEQPYANVRVDHAVSPHLRHPTTVRIAIVKILVDVAPDSRTYRASIAQTSGYDDLDAAAMSAATQTTYAPARFRCAPIEGTFVFIAAFETQ